MKQMTIIGVLLIVFGVFALAYQGFTYKTEEKVLDVGPITATAEKKKTVPLPPILGVTAIVGGIVLVVLGSKR
jgi:hypothetical protein